MNVLQTRLNFVKLIIQWWRERRARIKQERFDAGFRFAQNMLLIAKDADEADEAVDRLGMMTATADDFGTYDEFDAGIDQALRQYRWPETA